MLNPLPQIEASSVFLVSGGARGITAQCVIHIAQQYPCKWILLGRSAIAEPEPFWAKDCMNEAELKQRIMGDLQEKGEKPTPVKIQKILNHLTARRDIEATLQTLTRLGREVAYVSVDVTDLPALQAQLAAQVALLGPVTGIVHGAGNLADKLIENKTEQDFEIVYSTKVKGLENLLACVPANQLQYLVLFSSVAGFYGNAGQADYAIANEILNKSAHLIKKFHPACHVVSINWGPWDSGMVTPELKQAFAQRQITVIPIEVGAEMLLQEMTAVHHDTAQVVIGSPLVRQAGELDPELRSHRIHRRLTLAANPFLRDHVIGGYPVLPAMCAIAWIINLCEQLYPGHAFFSLENFKVLKGIVFDQSQSDQFIVDIQEVAKINSDGVVFDVRIWSEQETKKIRFHYSGQVTLRRRIPDAPTYAFLSEEQGQTISGASLYEDKTLFHGPSFQGVEQVLTITPEKLTMQCCLPTIEDRKQGQFPTQTFNPYTADVLIQSTLIWLKRFKQLGALPLEIQQIVQFKTVPFDQVFYAFIEPQLKTGIDAIFSINACDSSGQVYMRLSGVKMTMSDRLSQLFTQSVQSGQMVAEIHHH